MPDWLTSVPVLSGIEMVWTSWLSPLLECYLCGMQRGMVRDTGMLGFYFQGDTSASVWLLGLGSSPTGASPCAPESRSARRGREEGPPESDSLPAAPRPRSCYHVFFGRYSEKHNILGVIALHCQYVLGLCLQCHSPTLGHDFTLQLQLGSIPAVLPCA